MKNRNKKELTYMIIVALISIAMVLTLMIGVKECQNRQAENKPEPYQITNKCEENGKCYIETWIEVTPEEYIGLDVGDEYQIQGVHR